MGDRLIPLVVTLTAGGLVSALMVAALMWWVRREQARVTTLQEWAIGHGWVFLQSSQWPWVTRLPGHGKDGVGATLIGQFDNRRVIVADYSYGESAVLADGMVGGSRNHFVVVVVELDRMYPPVAVRPWPGLIRIAQGLIGERPPVTGNVSFDAWFRIDTDDLACARALIGPALIQAHLSQAIPPWSIVGTELLAVIPTSGKLRDPNSIGGYLTPLIRVADLLGR